jgi:hypothetical protein
MPGNLGYISALPKSSVSLHLFQKRLVGKNHAWNTHYWLVLWDTSHVIANFFKRNFFWRLSTFTFTQNLFTLKKKEKENY